MRALNSRLTVVNIPSVLRYCFALLSCLFISATITYADDSKAPATLSEQSNSPVTLFEVTPKRCVTLRQGQPCFVKLRFEWSSDETVKVCLYGAEDKELQCWSSTNSGSIVLPQTLPSTTEFKLIANDGVELQRATVAVSWVYKTKRSKRRWRLF